MFIMTILNLNEMPDDPAEALVWLSGVKAAVETELEDAFTEVYAELRKTGRFQWALDQGLHGKKRALAMTRRWNRENGRMVRWGDHLDPTSSAYDGS